MFKRLFSAAIVFGLAALAPPAVLAQTAQCAPREQVIERLQQGYSERLTGGGLQTPQQVLEIWSSPETGTFTVIVTRANGISCVVASGRHWTTIMAVRMDDGVQS